MSCCPSAFEAIRKAHIICLKSVNFADTPRPALLDKAVSLMIHPSWGSENGLQSQDYHKIVLCLVNEIGINFSMNLYPDYFYSWLPAYAAGSGNLKLLKHAFENGCEPHEAIAYIAALRGHLDCLKYAHQVRCPLTSRVTAAAAGIGRLDILQYAHENGCPWDEKTIMAAAEAGNLPCLKYAWENGCKTYTSVWEVTTIAAGNGDLPMLKWAHEAGFPWDRNTTVLAACENQLDCLLYCLENGCPAGWYTLVCLNREQKDQSLLKKILAHPAMTDATNRHKWLTTQ